MNENKTSPVSNDARSWPTAIHSHQTDLYLPTMKHGHHFVAIIIDNKRVSLAWGLEHVGSVPRMPVMFLVSPRSLERQGMDGAGMPMAAQNAAALEFQQVDVVPLADAEAQRTEGQAVGLRYPYAGIFLLFFVIGISTSSVGIRKHSAGEYRRDDNVRERSFGSSSERGQRGLSLSRWY